MLVWYPSWLNPFPFQSLANRVIKQTISNSLSRFSAAAVSAKTFGNRRLLPEVFPDDPSSQLMPVFLRAPQNSYASRASPAVLTCVVAHATKAAHFICHDDQVMNSTSDTQVVDEKTQLKARKITLEVTRKEVLDGIGNFNCNCYAASAQGSHSTPDVTVMQACK